MSCSSNSSNINQTFIIASPTSGETMDIYVTGGTYDNITGIATFTNNSGNTFSVTGFSFTGGTVSGATNFTGGLISNTISATSITAINYVGLPQDIYTYSGSVLGDTLTLFNTSGSPITITGFTVSIDSYTTGATLNNTTIEFGNNILGPNYYNVNLLPVLSSKTDVTLFESHTANTNNPHQTSFSNLTSTAHTHNVSDIDNLQPLLNDKFDKSGGTISGNLSVSSVTATTITATNYLGLPQDIYVTGGTYSNGATIFTNSTGGTFNINGYTTPFTGGSVSAVTIFQNGLTATSITANTVSATSITASNYIGLPIDVRVTGGTYSNGTTVFTNNTGGTFSVTGFSSETNTSFTGGTVSGATEFTNGLTANTLSATSVTSTNYVGLPQDIYTYSGSVLGDTLTLFNTSGSPITITGFSTGGTSNSSVFTGGTVSGATEFTNGLTANTITASIYNGLPQDKYTTGATLNNTTIEFGNNVLGPNSYNVNLLPVLSSKTDVTLFDSHTANTNNPHQTSFSGLVGTAHTHTISDVINLQTSLNNKFDKSGGTISGDVNITNGLTANTISATNVTANIYYGLPKDIYVTGGTFSSSSSTIIFKNNSGGTFDVTGITVSNSGGGTFTGGTVSGATVFTNGLTANTVSATTYYGDGSNLTGIVASWGGYETITVGENVNSGDLLYLSNDSRYYKADNSSENTSSTELRIALSNIVMNSTGNGLIQGGIVTSGLTSGAKYYVGTDGTYTLTQPINDGNIIRYVGTALSSNKLEFYPDKTYFEVSNAPATTYSYPNVRTIGTSQSALPSDSTIICLSGLTLTIPTAVGVSGKIYLIKSRTTGIIIINSTGGQLFDDFTDMQITGINDWIKIQSNGTNWIIIG